MDKQDRVKVNADKALQIEIVNNVFDHAHGHNHQEGKNVARTWKHVCQSIVYHIVYLGCFCGLAVIIGYESEWTMQESLDYVMTTTLTVGYDGHSEIAETSKLVAVVFIPIAVIGFVGRLVVGPIATKIMESRCNTKLRHDYDSYIKILEDIDSSCTAMDDFAAANDRIVSYGEYLEFMLVAMNKVDPVLLKDLRHHFHSSETYRESPASSLTKNDLIEAARRQKRSFNEQRVLQHATASLAVSDAT